MSRRVWGRLAGSFICICLLAGLSLWYYIGTSAFVQSAGEMVSEQATGALATKVEVGGISIASPFAVQADKLAVYDKKNNLIAKAESAEIRFSLFEIFRGTAVKAVKEVVLSQAEINLVQDAQGRWNYQDLLRENEEKSEFAGSVRLQDSKVKVDVAGTKLQLTELDAAVDCADMAELKIAAECCVDGARTKVSGLVKPDGANTGLELQLQTKAFDPGYLLGDTPYSGPVELEAKISGTSAHPVVRADIGVKAGEVYGYAFKNARADVLYQDNELLIHSLSLQALGGSIKLGMELALDDIYYDGHVVLQGVQLENLQELLPEVTGQLTADLGFKGQGTDVSLLSVYGDVKGKNGSYQGIGIPELHASFYQAGQDVIFDYVSMKIENGGELGLEGSIKNGSELDFSYTAAHLDLTLVKNFVPEADMSGWGDISGTVQGPSSNPIVRGRFSGLEGKLFQQPFRTMHGEFGGSLHGVRIKKFELENGGNVTWKAQGDIGFLGERGLNLQIDTMGARMEDIAALVAPDQPITGNVDNIITIKGTMSDPDITGYIHCYQGSYNGYLLSGMDGDYTVKNGVANLIDFHVFSPLVDMVLNGKVDIRTQAIDLRLVAKELDLARFGRNMPYPVSGHGSFIGTATGTINSPVFDGELKAGTLLFNGVEVTDAYGYVNYRQGRVFLAPLSFNQNGGTYKLNAWADINTGRVQGKAEIKNGDIHAILTVLNAKDNLVDGRLDGTLQLSGKLDSPQIGVYGYIGAATVGNYDIKNITLDATYAKRLIKINTLEGIQGSGSFKAEGVIDLDGEIDARFSARDIQCGLLFAAAGLDVDTHGLLALEAQCSGTVDRPEAEASFVVTNGGVAGSAFDSMTGLAKLRGPVIQLEQLVVKKEQAGKHYSVSANGMLPLKALTADQGEDLAVYDKMNIKLSLDEGDLSLLPVLSKQIEWAVGETDGTVILGGSLSTPTVEGWLGVKNGAVKFRTMLLPVTDINIKLVGSGTHLALEECSGKIGAGTYTMTGQTDLAGRELVNYHLQVEAKKLELQLPFFRGPLTMSANLHEDSFYGERLPKLEAKVLVQDILLNLPSIPQSEGELPHIILDVNVEAGRKVHFYNSSFANFWFSGNVHYGGTTHYIAPSGSLHIDKGNVSYLGNEFRILEGTANFNQVGSFLPSVDFFAVSRLNRTKVFLAINGPAEGWKLKLSSEPALSEAEIIKLLTFRTDLQNGQNSNEQMNGLLLAGMQMAFLGEIEDAVKDILFLDELYIKRDSGFSSRHSTSETVDRNNKDAYDIQVGKYLGDKMLLEYTHGLNNDRRSMGVRYEFDSRFSLAVGHDSEKKDWFAVETSIPF